MFKHTPPQQRRPLVLGFAKLAPGAFMQAAFLVDGSEGFEVHQPYPMFKTSEVFLSMFKTFRTTCVEGTRNKNTQATQEKKQ